MFENNNQKFYSFGRKFLKKLRPKFSIHYVVYTILLSFVVFSIVGIVTATTPNPGHPWAELGDGVFAVTNNQTGVRTYTFPDANATVLTTNAVVTVGQGGIGVGTLASNGILYGNGTGAVQALAVNASGTTQCLTQVSSGTPAWGSCGGASGLTIGTTTITSGSSGNILYNNAGVVGEMTTTGSGTVLALATSPVFVTPTLGAATATTINGNTFTTGTYTLTGTAGKTLNFTNSLTLSGTDSTTMTFPTTSATIARTDAAQTFTGIQTFSTAIALGSGGTGATDSQGAINAISQLTTEGDLLFRNATNSTRLPRGADAECLKSNTTTIVWGSCGGGGGTWDTIGSPAADQNLTFNSGEETAWTIEGTTATNFTMSSSTLTSGTLMSLVTTGTGALTGQKGLNVSLSGANGTGAQTTYGVYSSNTKTGTSNNVGIYATASGGTNNYAGIFEAGRVLIGTASDTTSIANIFMSRTLTTETGSTGLGVAGIHQNFTLNPTSGTPTQVGNRLVVSNTGTVVNTAIGQIIRMDDTPSSGTPANLIRGLEVVASVGSNTAGTNTGIRSTGKTFGVQAITTGAAGSVVLPAGLYAENTGTTQGDVARFYTGSMTSAPSMLQVYHDTSAFTGDALLMDMAVSGGGTSFTGDFLDLRNASVLKFKVTSAGVVSMGLSGTASTNAVCSSLANATTPTAGTAYEIRDCNAAPAADYAEMYPVESGIEFGDIVATGTEAVNTYDTTEGNIDWTKVKGTVTRLVKSNKNYQSNVIGIVVDNYGDFTSAGHNIKDTDNPMPVALNGRVPVKVANDSDNIMPGDYITTSNESGKATKANKAGQVIGKALESWTSSSGQATVMVYVEQGFYNGQNLTEFAGVSVTDGAFARQVLQQFLASQQNTPITSSELLLDRIAVGVEIITPKVVADQIATNIINSATGNDIGLVLSPGGKFVIGGQVDANSSVVNPAITFDAFGNATFAGKVTANEIDANSLAGIQDITDQINQLSEGQVAFSLTASVMNTLSGALTIAQADILKLQQDLELIQGTVDGLALDSDDLDTRLKLVEAFIARDEFGVPIGMATVGLSVSGDGLFTGKTQFEGLSFFTNTTSFAGAVSFASQTEFAVPPLYNKNSAGYALVKEGDRRARILFSEPYIATPVVNTSITFETEDNIDDTEASELFGNDVRFIVTSKDQTGFTILLNKNAPRDIRFSWNALSVKDPAVFESVFEGLIIDPIPDPIEDEEVSPEDTPTPNETPTCADPQVLDAVANICVDPTPTLDPTIDETPPPEPEPEPEPTSDPSLAA
jgi:hypothetical protein